MPTITLPSYEEWRVLLLLWKRAIYTAARNASHVLNVSGARPSDLGYLAEVGWIAAKRDGRPVDVHEDDQWWSYGLASTELRLTGKGLNWVCTNKHNLALFAVDEHATSRGAPLLKVTEVGGVESVVRLAERRLVTVLDVNAVEMQAAKLGTTVFRDLKTYTVKLTARGNNLINV